MHKIVFKGQIEDEFVEDDTGRQLAQRWEKGTLPTRLDINGNLYETSAIKAILKGFSNPGGAQNNAEFEAKVRKSNEIYEKEQKARLALSPEKRAQDVSSANLIYVSFHGKRMSKELEAKVVERQTKFYQENPSWPLARPSYYRDLMGKPKLAPTNRPATIGEMLGIGGLSLVERITAQAISKIPVPTNPKTFTHPV